MSSIEDKEKKIRRLKNKVAKDLRTRKYRQRTEPPKVIYDKQKYRNYKDYTELEDDEI